jgi:hypothetical protein
MLIRRVSSPVGIDSTLAAGPDREEKLLHAGCNATPAGVRTLDIGAIALACVLGALIGAWLAVALRQASQRRIGRRHNTRGKQGEAAAEALLRAHGCEILERQQRISYRIAVDRSERDVQLAVDFVVLHQGERVVAEVKTGPSATQLSHPDTRRQLLEYQLATGAPRVLLVDPERQRITEIAFPLVATQEYRENHEAPRAGLSAKLALVLLSAAAAYWAWQRSH